MAKNHDQEKYIFHSQHCACWMLGTVMCRTSLHWRHNDHDDVSNHQPHGCLPNRLFRRRSKKISKLRVTGLCAGNSPETGEFPAQMASNAENVSNWWRHHDQRHGDDSFVAWYTLTASTEADIENRNHKHPRYPECWDKCRRILFPTPCIHWLPYINGHRMPFNSLSPGDLSLKKCISK